MIEEIKDISKTNIKQSSDTQFLSDTRLNLKESSKLISLSIQLQNLKQMNSGKVFSFSLANKGKQLMVSKFTDLMIPLTTLNHCMMNCYQQ